MFKRQLPKVTTIILTIVAVLSIYLNYDNFKSKLYSQNKQEISYTQSTNTEKEIVSENCRMDPTPVQTEGPYYKTGSPQTNNIGNEIQGEKLKVTGFVFDTSCQPIAGAWLDFWQADPNGNYDNVSYRLRGHQFTNSSGQFELLTITPASYESRPPHIHVKIKTPKGSVLTSQLYFPDSTQNQTDSIFNPKLVMSVNEENGTLTGKFNFVVSQ